VKVPGIQGTARKADKYRYPKGHPKAGQYAPKAEAAKAAKVTRVVRRRGGRREALEPKGRGKVKKLRQNVVNIGRAFTTTAAAYTAIDAVNEAAANGRQVFVKVGGRILEIPAERQLDAAAWLADLKARFISEAPRNKAGKGYPFSLELSTGPNGYLVNLDRMEYFTAELRDALGPLSEARDLARDLAEYIERTAEQYLDVRVSADDIAEAWESEGSAPSEDDEE
jgi:hypothetical protein